MFSAYAETPRPSLKERSSVVCIGTNDDIRLEWLLCAVDAMFTIATNYQAAELILDVQYHVYACKNKEKKKIKLYILKKKGRDALQHVKFRDSN